LSPVLDASVFIAAISPAERHHARARQLLAQHPDTEPFLVPALFRIEVVAALARRGEPAAFVDTVDAIAQGPRFHAVALDADLLAHATEVARGARLRAYDAVYVTLALRRRQPILTLDAEVVERGTSAFPELRVFGRD
jgi:predicted nucleic acid-binding protein